MNELADAYNAGDQAAVDVLFHDQGQVFDPSSIPETGTKQPSPSTWVNAANETDGHLTIEEVCVFRSGDATGSMSLSSAALQRAGVDQLSLHFKVRLTAGTIRQIVIGVSSGARWDRVCARYEDQMAQADAPC